MFLVSGLSQGAGGCSGTIICVVGGIGLRELLDHVLPGQICIECMLTPATGGVASRKGSVCWSVLQLGSWGALFWASMPDAAACVSFCALLEVSLPVGDNVAVFALAPGCPAYLCMADIVLGGMDDIFQQEGSVGVKWHCQWHGMHLTCWFYLGIAPHDAPWALQSHPGCRT